MRLLETLGVTVQPVELTTFDDAARRLSGRACSNDGPAPEGQVDAAFFHAGPSTLAVMSLLGNDRFKLLGLSRDEISRLRRDPQLSNIVRFNPGLVYPTSGGEVSLSRKRRVYGFLLQGDKDRRNPTSSCDRSILLRQQPEATTVQA
jgi:hypothetical protein